MINMSFESVLLMILTSERKVWPVMSKRMSIDSVDLGEPGKTQGGQKLEHQLDTRKVASKCNMKSRDQSVSPKTCDIIRRIISRTSQVSRLEYPMIIMIFPANTP